jgi:hypothetical protein
VADLEWFGERAKMKIEKDVLSVLCAGVCVWAARMVVGVIGLARHQGPMALLALLEVAAFLGAGLIPLLMVWLSPKKKRKWPDAIWAVCALYVVVLALNYSRYDPLAGTVRLALWISIIILFIRASKNPSRPNKLPLPTPASVTPAAGAPAAPAFGVAHQ